MTQEMSKHFTTTALLRFTLPTIAMMIFTSCYTIVDGFFVSNFAGKTALAAVNLILPPVFILSSVGMMVGTGGSALVAKILGEGDATKARKIFTLLTLFTFVAGTILAVIGFFAMDATADFLGGTGELKEMAVIYGCFMTISMPFFMLQYAFQSFFVTAGKPKLGFMVILAAGLSNIVLDFVFVGLLNGGLVSAALATNIGEFIGGGLPLLYFMKKRDTPLYFVRPHFSYRQTFSVLGKTLMNGSSEMVANISMSLVGILYNWQLLRFLGEDGVAAYGVIMYTALIFASIFMGYSIGSSPLMSFHYGAKNHSEMRSLLRKSLGLVAGASLVMYGAGQLFAEPLSAIFVSYNAELLALTVKAYKIYALCFLFMGFAIYSSAFFTALNNGLVSALISFLRTLVFEVAAVIILPYLFGIDAIWLAVTVADMAACLVAGVFMLALGKRYGYRKTREYREFNAAPASSAHSAHS